MRARLGCIAVVFGLSVVFAPACAAAPAAQPSTLGVASIATLADRTPAGYRTEAAAIRAVHARWIRIVVNWNELEPAPGQFAWARIDGAVEAARASGLSVLALLAGPAPPWAAVPPYSASSIPADNTVAAASASVIARRYGSRIAAWEVWNEPNLATSWTTPDPVAYARYFRAVAAALHAASPGTTVLLGGLSTNPGGYPIGDFVDATVRTLGGRGFDGVALHPYTFPYPPTADPLRREQSVPAVRGILDRAGRRDAKIWVTEFGQPTGDSFAGVSEAKQADFIASGLTFFRSQPRMGPIFLFTSRDWSTDPTNSELNFGLYRFDWSPKEIARRLMAQAPSDG
ncbi:cellulase family glycosylhydrolase [Williamsia phyllosphaerae]|uniref:Glycoside hydrolase family 5 domain-containing protein n=1 Tax=Williamsia phyllosphaerae TaxID=885042 RepID=A0ABQ1UPC1_9NOCA|nr:cellulase family glycosylhydrolase [Williamsia phyllosphaerae]GGF23000.1 hypothetical protein GCM10007298_18670 [Williamsia phyllosphaerae]